MFFFNDKQPPAEVDLISFEYIDTNKNIDDINDTTTQNTPDQTSTIINDDIECKFIDDNVIIEDENIDDVVGDIVEEEEEEDYEDDEEEDYDEEGENIIYVI